MSEATELDKTRLYLRPVEALQLPGHPDGVCLGVYEWLPAPIEAWATGPTLCGYSTRQVDLADGTEATCATCVGLRPDFEQILAHRQRVKEDAPEVLRKRADAAERQVKQARTLEAKWLGIAAERDGATVRLDVAAGILKATLDGFNDLLAEVEGR